MKVFFKINNGIYQPMQVNARDNKGNTALHLAVECHNVKAVELLLSNGADPNLANEDRLTPMHIMCKINNDDELVKIFFKINDKRKQAVKVDAKDKLGRTPLQWAVASLKLHAHLNSLFGKSEVFRSNEERYNSRTRSKDGRLRCSAGRHRRTSDAFALGEEETEGDYTAIRSQQLYLYNTDLLARTTIITHAILDFNERFHGTAATKSTRDGIGKVLTRT
ncbi:unnamed protein product [Trichogramma brassicae]|uniref:Uncharacterized protein n=1 Tax=Trichogramma brassicae TaxID=86971 RepID=A0A6H5I2W9_9HYME|nr:unnamed protein product [Trichogramma brassicae]